MRKRHQHYRQHHRKIENQNNSAEINTSVNHSSIDIDAGFSHSLSIKNDLKKTLMISAVLIIILLVIYYTDSSQNWILPLGNQLYSLLHIR